MNLSKSETGAIARLKQVPYWRGEKKVLVALEQIVRKAAEAAGPALRQG